MNPTQIPPGQFAQFQVAGQDAGGNPEPVTGTATIDNYTAAYVMNYKGPGGYAVVPKGTPPAGTSVPVNVTFDAKDSGGNALPALVVPFLIMGPPAPPPATSLVLSGLVVGGFAGQPTAGPDPGSATITMA